MTLPNFLIIGAAKAGTTSLYHYLRQHPDVFMSPIKETNWFEYEGQKDERFVIRTREAYERLFDGVTSQRAIGEASPQYLNSSTAPARIDADLPGVRLIAALRNPADRAYSSYLNSLRAGVERRPLDEAMRPGTRYVEQSLYHPRLSRYFERFERGRIKVIVYDDLAADPAAVMRDLFAFLGVDDTFAVDVSTRHNAAMLPRTLFLNWLLINAVAMFRRVFPSALRGTGVAAWVQRPLLRPPDPLPPSIRRRLLEHFCDDVAKTGDLIGRDLAGWLE